VSCNQWPQQNWPPKVGQKVQKFDGAINGEKEEAKSGAGGKETGFVKGNYSW